MTSETRVSMQYMDMSTKKITVKFGVVSRHIGCVHPLKLQFHIIVIDDILISSADHFPTIRNRMLFPRTANPPSWQRTRRKSLEGNMLSCCVFVGPGGCVCYLPVSDFGSFPYH